MNAETEKTTHSSSSTGNFETLGSKFRHETRSVVTPKS